MTEPQTLDLTELRVLSDLLSRAKLAGSAGMTFGNERNLYTTLGYKDKIEPKDYRDRYERGGVAARVVDAAPQATWQEDPVIIEDEDPEASTPFEESVFELQDRLQMWEKLKRADVLAGLGEYSVVLIGARGDLASPLTKVAAENVLYLSPFSQQDVGIKTVMEDATDARFGQPEIYEFKRTLPQSTSIRSRGTAGNTTKEVHWTRVLHVADGVLDQQFVGTPRMKKTWNYLDDLDKVVGGGSEAFWIRINPGTQFDLDADMELTQDQLADLQEKSEEFYHGIKRMIRTRGVTINQLQAAVSAFNAQVDAILTLISATTGIPKRILMGSERGELASTQDRSNWGDQISDRQLQYATPMIVRPLIDRFIEIGALPEPEAYVVRWSEGEVLDEDEKSIIADRLAGINKKAGEVVITGAEIRDKVLGLSPLDEAAELEDVEETEDDFEDVEEDEDGDDEDGDE